MSIPRILLDSTIVLETCIHPHYPKNNISQQSSKVMISIQVLVTKAFVFLSLVNSIQGQTPDGRWWCFACFNYKTCAQFPFFKIPTTRILLHVIATAEDTRLSFCEKCGPLNIWGDTTSCTNTALDLCDINPDKGLYCESWICNRDDVSSPVHL